MTLKKISEKLRKKHTESEIVLMIKNREVPEIKEGLCLGMPVGWKRGEGAVCH